MTNPAPVALDTATTDFIQHHVSINVASTDRLRHPAVARAYGCRVSDDRLTVTVYLFTAHCRRVLDNLRQHDALAVAFTRPSTHQSLQLKAQGIEVTAVSAADRERMQYGFASFADEIRALGYHNDFIQAMTPDFNADAIGLRFVPLAAYVQTPGPNAGQKVHPQK